MVRVDSEGAWVERHDKLKFIGHCCVSILRTWVGRHNKLKSVSISASLFRPIAPSPPLPPITLDKSATHLFAQKSSVVVCSLFRVR
jgi:hypothetical protein